MSDPKQHVTSLDLSRKLAEKGAPRDTLFYWVFYIRNPPDRMSVISADSIKDTAEYNDCSFEQQLAIDDAIPAYTASELGAWLPKTLPFTAEDSTTYVEREAGLCGIHHKDQWGVFYIHNGRNISALPRATADTEANARARLLLKLIDAGHVSFTQDEKDYA